MANDPTDQAVSPVIVASSPDRSARRPGNPRPMSATDKVNARAEELAAKAAQGNASEKAAKERIAERGGVYQPGDHRIFDDLETWTPVNLRGILKSAIASNSGSTIYLQFTDDASDSSIKGAVRKDDFTGEYAPETFAPMIGKEITLDGKKYKESTKRRLVKIVSPDQIEIRK